MSWFSDKTGINIDVASSLGSVRNNFQSMFQGGNVLDNLKNIATTGVATYDKLQIPGLSVLGGSQGVQNFLETNKVANAVTAGFSKSVGESGAAVNDLSQGTSINNLTVAEQQGLTQTLALAAAIATAGALAPSLLPASPGALAADAGAAKVTVQGVSSGNVTQVISGADTLVGGADDSGTLDSIASATSAISQITNPGGRTTSLPSPARRPASVPIQPAIPTPVLASSPSSTPLLLGGAILAKIALFS